MDQPVVSRAFAIHELKQLDDSQRHILLMWLTAVDPVLVSQGIDCVRDARSIGEMREAGEWE